MGWLLVGADASGKLRALGAWLAHFDGGEYAKLVSTEDLIFIHTTLSYLVSSVDKVRLLRRQEIFPKRLIYAYMALAQRKLVV